MIVAMKHLTLLCMASQSEKTLEKLRSLGCVHLDLSSAASPELSVARGDVSEAENALRILSAAAKGAVPSPASSEANLRDEDLLLPVSFPEYDNCAKGVLFVDAARQRLIDGAFKLSRTIKQYIPFGEFDPASVTSLREKGFSIELVKYLTGVKLSVEGGYVQVVSSDERNTYGVVVKGPQFASSQIKGGAYEVVPLITEKLSVMQNRLAMAEEKIADFTNLLAKEAQSMTEKITALYPELLDKVQFAAARDVIASQGEISYVTGWMSEDSIESVRNEAKVEGWALAVRDPKEDEVPPTLIRPPKIFAPVTALFKGLGIAPAYNESDVSVPFMCYFSLFFAMLVGDGGYGTIIFILTMLGWFKAASNKSVRPWLILMTVFSLGTIAWGFLSNTWFGAGLPFAQDWASVKWLADPSYKNMMFLCFTIGASHLVLARVWSGICIINDRTCLSQFGWAGILLFMYWVTNSIVGIFSSIPNWMFVVFGISLVLVFGFTLKGNEFKSRGIEIGMLPLNIMSALGDIISYVRLFAVGLASVKVAQNFNDMALANSWPIWMKCSVSVLILLIGHALNFVMAGLSILVHAVRLNTLEFSNHKGVSWSGYQFNPFKKTKSK